MTNAVRLAAVMALASLQSLLGCKEEPAGAATDSIVGAAAPASASATAPPGPPPNAGNAPSAQVFVATFMSYVDRYHRAPGQAGASDKRPECHKESENPACEHGRSENGVALRARWRPTAPATVRLFTAEPYRGPLGVSCKALHPQGEEIQRWTAAGGARVQCAVPRKEGDAIWVLVEESPGGSRLSAFYAQHLAWDTAFASRAFAGAPKPPMLPEAPAAPMTSASASP